MSYLTKFMSKAVSLIPVTLFLLSLIGTPSKAKAGTWTSVGPGGGNIRALVTSPNYAVDQTLFAGTFGGGVYRSSNGGTSWTPVNTGLSNLYQYSLAISPVHLVSQSHGENFQNSCKVVHRKLRAVPKLLVERYHNPGSSREK